MLISIKKFAEICGVTVETIRNWEKEGKITSQRTQGGHRRFELEDVFKINDFDEKIIKRWENTELLNDVEDNKKIKTVKYFEECLKIITNENFELILGMHSFDHRIFFVLKKIIVESDINFNVLDLIFSYIDYSKSKFYELFKTPNIDFDKELVNGFVEYYKPIINI